MKEDNSIIYKFRSWKIEHERNVLLQNELFFTSPGDFNDPFDFKINVDYSKLDTNEKRLTYINTLLTGLKTTLIERNINIEQKKNELLWRLENEIVKFQSEFDETNNSWVDKRFGIISFSSRWDSILLWSHYADKHKGYCIGFDKNKFIELNLCHAIGPVQYNKSLPRIDPLISSDMKSLFMKSHSKAEEWSYEKEFRILKLWDTFDPTLEERKLRYPKEILKEVIIGLNIPTEDEQKIIEYSKSINIPIYKIFKVNKQYLLDRMEI